MAVQNCPAACLHRWTELQQGLHDSVARAITERNWSSIATAGQASGSSSSPWLHISSQPSWKVAFPQIFHRFPITCVLIPDKLHAMHLLKMNFVEHHWPPNIFHLSPRMILSYLVTHTAHSGFYLYLFMYVICCVYIYVWKKEWFTGHGNCLLELTDSGRPQGEVRLLDDTPRFASNYLPSEWCKVMPSITIWCQPRNNVHWLNINWEAPSLLRSYEFYWHLVSKSPRALVHLGMTWKVEQ